MYTRMDGYVYIYMYIYAYVFYQIRLGKVLHKE